MFRNLDSMETFLLKRWNGKIRNIIKNETVLGILTDFKCAFARMGEPNFGTIMC